MAIDVVPVGYGRPATDLIAHQVAKAKEGQPLAPVSVVVASNHAGVAMRRELAARGGLAAVTFLTAHRLAEMLGTARLAGAGRRPVSPAVVAAAVRAVLAADAGLFQPVASHPATEEALAAAHRLLVEVSEAGLEKLAGQSPRANDVVRIHRAVRAGLSAAWYDEHDLLLAAAEAVDDEATGRASVSALGPLLVHLPQEMGPATVRLLGRLAERAPVIVNVGLTGDQDADHHVLQGLARLVGSTDVPPPPATARPLADRIVATSDPDEEVRAATRLLVDAMVAGTPLARTALLYASQEPYSRLVRDHLDAAGVPWNGAPARSVGEALLGRTLRSLLSLPDRNFARRDVLGFLASSPVMGVDRRPVPARAWERISREAGVVDGDDWERRLFLFADEALALAEDADADGQEGKARHLRGEAERARALRSFTAQLRQDLGHGEQCTTWARSVEWARSVLGRYLGPDRSREDWPRDERDAAQRVEAALERLAGLDALGGPAPSLEVFRRSLDAELATSLRRVGRFGEGVLVGQLSLAVGLDLDLVIVLGLAEGTLPARRLEDSLLPDSERLATGELRSRAELADDDHRHLLAAVAAGQEAVLCFPRGDLRRPGDRTASRWLLADAAALAGRDTVLTQDLPRLGHEHWLADVASYAGGIAQARRPATEQEHNLRCLMANTGPLEQHPVVLDDPVLGAGMALAMGRQSTSFTRFDGNLQELPLQDPTATDAITSPTRLQAWASCPHAYLLEHVLHVQVAQYPERTFTMSPLHRGSLVHEILERFVTEAVGEGGPEGSWSTEQRGRLTALAKEACDRYEARGLTGRSIFWRRDRTAILADLERFLDADDARRARCGARPVAAELRFGFGGAGRDPVLFPLPDGRSIALRGSVDRVDRAPDGTLFAIDYKTGRVDDYRGLGPENLHRNGTKLQLPVYAAAARMAHGTPASAVHAAYWFVTDKGRFEWIGYDLTPAVEAQVGQVLATIADGIRAGLFPARPPRQRAYGGHRQCDYCDPDGLGTAERRREWERKRQDPALATYLDLCGPEEVGAGAR